MAQPKAAVSPGDSEYKPGIPDEADDRMTFNLKVGDRRVLEAKAKASRISPTAWLVKKITEPEGPGAIRAALSIVLDKTRRKAVDDLAKKLGFYHADDLAKDLLYKALDDPKATEDFLFGSLRNKGLASTEAQDENKERKLAA